MDGEHILARLRSRGHTTPVIMLTARDAARDKIRNLNLGADDYLCHVVAGGKIRTVRLSGALGIDASRSP